MHKQRKHSYAVGPGAASLLMIVVILCLTVLGILGLISARADHRLSMRNQQMSLSYHEASAQLEQALAQLDGVLQSAREGSAADDAYLALVRAHLPEGFTLDGRMAQCQADAGASRVLTMSIEITAYEDLVRRYRVDSVVLGGEIEAQEPLHTGLLMLGEEG